eukprot:CAMPEP_0197715660 /NCGR_PEP_ID=MMETSP1434-20131217/780_1 /TAXON_ID=265543 /ORGANISM="Minutocellus polymorphus, Strain CCMP3303" /LENGTH=357 /DNA_ID=CAMNT_0043299849 /DNA_START=49 /DNA_END=1122 /DNA_ORIENTATION=-
MIGLFLPLTGVLLLTPLASAGSTLFGAPPIVRSSPVNTPASCASKSAPYLSHINNRNPHHPLTRRSLSLLSIRGGGTAASSPSAALTFGQNLAGSVFSTFATTYGLACIAAPDQTAKLFYNGYARDNEADDASVGRYLMRLMGSLACGIGLTSAFAIGAEIKAGPGTIPSTETFDKSIGVGLVPRLFLILHSLILSSSIPTSLRICGKDAVVALVQTCLFLWSMFAPNEAGIRPDTIIFLEVAFHVMLGPLLFFKPSVLFEDSAAPSKHEKFMTRMLASYSVMGAVLVAALQHPAINALPAMGLAATIWVASLLHLTFVRKDVEECGTSTPVHILMMIIGTLVAIGGLQQYLFLAPK